MQWQLGKYLKKQIRAFWKMYQKKVKKLKCKTRPDRRKKPQYCMPWCKFTNKSSLRQYSLNIKNLQKMWFFCVWCSSAFTRNKKEEPDQIDFISSHRKEKPATEQNNLFWNKE